MSNAGNLKALYPFLHGQRQAPARLGAALLYSVEQKARDSRETNMRFFGQRIQECRVADYHILWDLVHTLLADDRGSATTRGAAA